MSHFEKVKLVAADVIACLLLAGGGALIEFLKKRVELPSIVLLTMTIIELTLLLACVGMFVSAFETLIGTIRRARANMPLARSWNDILRDDLVGPTILVIDTLRSGLERALPVVIVLIALWSIAYMLRNLASLGLSIASFVMFLLLTICGLFRPERLGERGRALVWLVLMLTALSVFLVEMLTSSFNTLITFGPRG